MSRILTPALLAALGLALLASACSSDSGDRRVIQITQHDEGCTPTTIDLKTAEDVTFEVKNDGKKDREVEGIDGTKMDEVLIPSGKTRNISYSAPSEPGTAKIKCYVPGGDSAIIELHVSGDGANSSKNPAESAEDKNAATNKQANETVKVDLASFKVAADRTAVANGPTKFVATNTSATDVHELAVLRTKADGSYENTGEVEDIDPTKSGEIVLDLPAGDYLLACLIAPGEAGSTVDHFEAGMKLPFTVK